MITQLRIQNFKSWRDTGQMRFAPLTAFFGPNSSGKTSILQFLLMLKQTVQSTDQSLTLELGTTARESYVDLGVFGEVIHHKSTSRAISFHLSWQSDTTVDFTMPFSDADDNDADDNDDITEENVYETEFGFSAVVREDNAQKIQLEKFEYLVEDCLQFGLNFQFGLKMESQSSATKERVPEHAYILDLADLVNDKTYQTRVSAKHLLPIKFYNFYALQSLAAIETFSSFIAELTSQIEQIFRSVLYLGPLREYPQRYYLQTGGTLDGVGNRGELTVPALLAGTARNPFQLSLFGFDDSEIEVGAQQSVARWLKTLNLIYSFSLLPLAEGRKEYEVRVKQTPESPEVLLTEVGFGVSQILPILTQCYYASPGSILIFEQPEIHLHPAVQSGLADVFVDVIKNRGIQIILESHSEHLLHRLQRRLAEEQLLPHDIALYFTHIENGESVLDELQIDEYGSISNWPQNFFGDEMGDLVATTKAAMTRQMNNAPHSNGNHSNGTVKEGVRE